MIKRFGLSILILLLLCGCSDSRTLKVQEQIEELTSLGYKKEVAKMILNLEETNQTVFKREYNQKLNDLISDVEFKEENLKEYLQYNFDIQTLLHLVNNNIVNTSNYSFIKNCTLDKWYIEDNLELYLKYKDQFFNARDCIEYVNTKSYLPYYEEVIDSDLSAGDLILANKHYYLGTYEPDELITIDTQYASSAHHRLKVDAAAAFLSMAEAAEQNGYDIYVTSAYRSYDYQEGLHDGYLKKDSEAVVDSYSARAGFSDHQIGLTVDILADDRDFSNFESSKESKWLAENAHNYGFILRYPKGKEKITGYIYESWHYRYVGVEVATYIYENGITFDEYYAYFVENKKS